MFHAWNLPWFCCASRWVPAGRAGQRSASCIWRGPGWAVQQGWVAVPPGLGMAMPLCRVPCLSQASHHRAVHGQKLTVPLIGPGRWCQSCHQRLGSMRHVGIQVCAEWGGNDCSVSRRGAAVPFVPLISKCSPTSFHSMCCLREGGLCRAVCLLVQCAFK